MGAGTGRGFGRRLPLSRRLSARAGVADRCPCESAERGQPSSRIGKGSPAGGAGSDLHFGARSARDNPAWPKVGIFGHRNMRRVNWLGVSRTRLLRTDGLDLHVAELDAVDGTPVLDIKPWFAEFGPRGEVRQAAWATEMLRDYF
ncbi:TrmO family methyltransferase domain-containing protein [Nocardia farcinica]|uniref:TrmO family methyltransferase domain-containing protein n=1 Tax=Nocardia farcinica TaxID=37329 RepID=UPI00280391A2|nr:TrmO family methyltransferase [Nocardia farcinica]